MHDDRNESDEFEPLDREFPDAVPCSGEVPFSESFDWRLCPFCDEPIPDGEECPCVKR
jgi:hypothetical protein